MHTDNWDAEVAMETACLHCDRKDPPSTGKGEGTGVTRVGEGHATTGTHLLPGHHQRCLGREGSGSAGRQPPPQRASSPALSPAVAYWLLPGEKAEGQSASLRRRQRGRVPHRTEGRGAEGLIAQKAEGQSASLHRSMHSTRVLTLACIHVISTFRGGGVVPPLLL